MPDIGEVQLTVGSLSVLLGAPQWGFTLGSAYLEQVELTTTQGGLFRQPWAIELGVSAELRFAKTDAVIEALRAVSHYAGRTGERVSVVLDAVNAPATAIWVDWQEMVAFTRIIENREEVVLTLQQQSEGL